MTQYIILVVKTAVFHGPTREKRVNKILGEVSARQQCRRPPPCLTKRNTSAREFCSKTYIICLHVTLRYESKSIVGISWNTVLWTPMDTGASRRNDCYYTAPRHANPPVSTVPTPHLSMFIENVIKGCDNTEHKSIIHIYDYFDCCIFLVCIYINTCNRNNNVIIVIHELSTVFACFWHEIKNT